MSINEGDIAPDFQLTADDGSTVRLSEHRGKRVVLFFYPRADTPGCTKEACEFRDLTPEYDSRDVAVFGISPDSVADVAAFRKKYDLPYHLLADAQHEVAERYGVWKEKSMYGKKFWGTERSTFVVDPQGRIESVYRKVKPAGHAAAVLNAL